MKKKKVIGYFIFCMSIVLCGCSSQVETNTNLENVVNEESLNNQFSEEDEESAQKNQVNHVESKVNTFVEKENISEESTEEEDDLENGTLRLVMVGDVLLHTPIEEAAVQDDGSYDFHHLFSQVKDSIESADLALVNQEVILGGSELGISGYPAFNGPFEVADALYDTGFDVVLHGTNHALDKGERGILNCLQNWEEKYPDMKILGIHDSVEDSQQICYIEQKDMKIAILNYTYGTNGISVPSGKEYLVDYLSEEKVRSNIEEAEQNADFTIACPHWGTEYEHGISSEQKKWTQIFLEEGVDLVIGTHPHVIEPIQWISDENHEMLVYYSLGNFINCTSGSGAGTAERMVGGMADVTLAKDEITNQVVIQNYQVEPLVTQMAYGQNEITTYFFKDYTDELAQENKVREKDNKFSYSFCETLCEEVFQDVWKR